MNATTNPFTPGAGCPPPVRMGNDYVLNNANKLLDYTWDGSSPQGMLLIGLRGVGKTVLLNQIERMAIDRSHISIIRLEIDENRSFTEQLVPEFRKVLYELNRFPDEKPAIKRGVLALQNFVNSAGVNYKTICDYLEPLQGIADSGDLKRDLCDLLLTVAAAAKSRQRTILLLIDEMQYMAENELCALIFSMKQAYHITAPIALVGAGLPNLSSNAVLTQSNVENLFRYCDIEQLNKTEAQEVISIPAKRAGREFTQEALDAIFHETHGYPYFLQIWAYNLWNTTTAREISLSDVIKAKPYIKTELDRNFFRKYFNKLTPKEQLFMHFMARYNNDECTLNEVQSQMKSSSADIARIQEQLVRKGMLSDGPHYSMQFTIPLFQQFLLQLSPLYLYMRYPKE